MQYWGCTGDRKSQPPTETTSFTASPEMLSGVKFVKVVPEVVCTDMIPGGAGVGEVLPQLEGATK
jgi:hypothetical protein